MEKDFRESALDAAERDPESTKARILKSAEDVFARGGYKGTTTRDIAEAAGVNVALVHYHWGSKQELWNAVNFDVFSRSMQELADIYSETAKGKTKDKIRENVAQLFDVFAHNPNMPLLIRGSQSGAGGESWVEKFGTTVLDINVEYTQEKTDLDFEPADIKLAVYFIFGAFQFFFGRPELIKLFFDEDVKELSGELREKAIDTMCILITRFGQIY